MATGHVNPGYEKLVSSNQLALDNPTGAPKKVRFQNEELEAIKAKAREVWAVKDKSETTYGYYFSDPLIKDQIGLRPSSPTRRNNPHPHLVFLSARLKHLPGYFNPNATESTDEQKVETIRESGQSGRIKQPVIKVYHNANQYLQTLTKDEADVEENKLINLGIDTKSNNIRVKSATSRSLSNVSTIPDNKFKSESNIDLIAGQNKTNRLLQFQPNQLNRYLYEDTRMYKEKYANGDHGIPFKPPRRPIRGDFLIHPDWHAGLKHHRLPYY